MILRHFTQFSYQNFLLFEVQVVAQMWPRVRCECVHEALSPAKSVPEPPAVPTRCVCARVYLCFIGNQYREW